MLYAIRDGIVIGLIISVLIGPVFFLLIELSIKEGFRSAIAMDIGIILSDAVCILVAYFGMAALLEDDDYRFAFIMVGSTILIVMGFIKIIPRKKKAEDVKLIEIQVRRSNPFWLVVKGFFYNFLNPSTIIFWITTVGTAVAIRGAHKGLIALEFGTTLLVVFLIDISKAWFAKRMRQALNPSRMRKANVIMGVFFIVFATFLIYRAFTGGLDV